MSDYLNNLDKPILKVIRDIGRAADGQGLRVYLVGGIVRDIILGRKNLDIDIVAEGQAISFARKIAKATGAKATSYSQFGTATLHWPFGLRIDFVAARQETYARPGALPQVCPGTLRDDLFRRDFTINAMAISLNKDGWGQLVDEFGGMQDLQEKKVRVLHGQSFIDDPTRILRAVRFEQRLGFQIETLTLGFLKEALQRKEKVFDNVKPARYFTEFKKMLSEEHPDRHLARLQELGALPVVDAALETDFRLLSQVQQRLNRAPKDILCSRWLVSLMAIAETMSGAKRQAFLRKFPFRREERESILQAARSKNILRKLAASKLSRSQVYGILKPFYSDVAVYLWLRSSQKKVIERLAQYLRHDAGTRIDVNGEDLKRLGAGPGKRIGTILQKILFMKIDGRVKNREQQLTAAAALIGKVKVA